MRKICCLLFALLSMHFSLVAAQNIDVLHYKFELELSDGTDAINGKATINLKFLNDASFVDLDLASLEEEKGMAAFRVSSSGMPLRFSARNDKIKIWLQQTATKGTDQTFEIEYIGVPKDGLIISKNSWGDRTFFSDNWPDRARHWLPLNDRPDDKASVEFIVKAPQRYKVVSNGLLQSEKVLGNGLRVTHWKEVIPIPSKVMVIGAASFAVKNYPVRKGGVPVSAWVYPQDSAKGFYDYAIADGILHFFEDYIGPFPYKKLANVQSTTMFGGMENASAIFYGEKTVTGNRSTEALIAHEIVHQWFGNTATEKSFSHLWLSEGFATYLTHMYIEQKYGVDSFYKRLADDRQKVIQFAKTSKQAVVDSTSDYMDLLNANSYQKGGWVLHMLRRSVGDSAFKKIIQTYYVQYKVANADSKDFEAVAEAISGKDLTSFFGQWLYEPGVPAFEIKTDNGSDMLVIEIKGEKNVYHNDLEVQVIDAQGATSVHVIPIREKLTSFKIKTKGPVKLKIDPEMKLLFSNK